MYIESIRLQSIRTFAGNTIEFVHPDRDFRNAHEGVEMPRPRLPNVNLVLGDNGAGKSTLLQAIALSAFGPVVMEANLGVRNMVRTTKSGRADNAGYAHGGLLLHEQDGGRTMRVESPITISRRGELESIEFDAELKLDLWRPVYESENDAFFVVAYGATRRVEPGESLDMGARTKSRFLRAQRVQSVFQDSYSLIPLTYWLPKLNRSNPGRYTQVVHLIDRLLKPTRFTFTGAMAEGDYLFERAGVRVPFQGLSDGYRAFVGWVGDLLYHVCFGCPKGKKLVENCGVVLVDEIDLHLHPKWQMKVVKTVAEALPRMQFILTSHSPLVAGSLEWMNVVRLKLGAQNRTSVVRTHESIHGLDADQILLTDLFGLKSTRAATKKRRLDQLTKQARAGDSSAAKELVAELARGTEEPQ